MFTSFADLFGGGALERDNRPKRAWTLPPAPGPTLRQRIERKEREAGLRCFDVSCGVGPSDEEPFGASEGEGGKQVSIMSMADHTALMCGHTFHNTCLVSAERVALSAKGAEGVVETGDGQVEVLCPICRGAGCVSRAEWDAGVEALA
ncbi:hypothetical protein CPB84DRAFT_1685168 [Gymnopilus junonius]|uniref:RING-type domain-containing protein n=1 Tax=Gymnopilus junonius TaxID=109634 RepID=A0A9P5NG43_GYMJU|nr:hypothetical protein CPB84DRAFT_1685168 [Gymnopilus junonius]